MELSERFPGNADVPSAFEPRSRGFRIELLAQPFYGWVGLDRNLRARFSELLARGLSRDRKHAEAHYRETRSGDLALKALG